jgi:hypothetical protein
MPTPAQPKIHNKCLSGAQNFLAADKMIGSEYNSLKFNIDEKWAT